MKKYKFRLQTVLEIKEKNLEHKLLELAQIINMRLVEEGIKDRLTNQRNNLQNSIVSVENIDSPISLFEVQNSRSYWEHLGTMIKRQDEKIERIKHFEKLKKEEVNNALKEKKILENLKEKEQKKYYLEFLADERKELDDIALSRYKTA